MFAADIPSAVTEDECRKLAALTDGGAVLEMGAHYGRSTIALAATARVVHSVDWHQGDGHAGHGDSLITFRANLDRYGVAHKVIAHVGRFEDVLPTMRSGQYDLVFLDGQHDRASVERDYALARRLLARGGAFAFHDYDAGNPLFGVTEAVDALGLPVDRIGNLAVVYP